MFDAPEISIVVTNWNGAAFIEECVSTLWASGEACGHPFELIVVDDVSSDRSPDLVAAKFPQVRLVRNEVNLGFAGASNRGGQEARGSVILMMNNDMRVPPECVARAVAPFFEPRAAGAPPLFAVGLKTVDWNDGSPNHLCMDAAWRRGGIGKVWSDPQTRCRTTFPQGGSAAYDRALFLQMGGFDPIFYPTYWDDYDLSYRACKAGWEVLYEPAAVADHLGQASLKRQTSYSRREQIVERNRLWFNWLNLDDPLLIARHVLAIPWICARDVAKGHGVNGVLGLLRALRGLPRVLRRRSERRRSALPSRRTDRELVAPETWGKARYYEV